MTGELHAASLLRINRVMKCLCIQPLGNHLFGRLFCTLVLATFIAAPAFYYFSFEYSSEYIYQDEPLSLIFDMSIYGTLITIHIVIVIERIWRNSRQEVDGQLEEVLIRINEQLGKQVDLQRVRIYCNAAYGSLFIRCLIIVIFTMFAEEKIIYYSLYSELVLLVSFTEFTLYSTVILFLYQELTLAGSVVVQELHRTSFELSSVRRMTLDKLKNLQRIHSLLWQSIRSLGGLLHRSLITMLLKCFLDSTTIPFWIYLNHVEQTDVTDQFYCGIDECVKILEVVVPCWICTRCDVMQRRFRSMFYTLTKDRRNSQLNAALNRLCLQLGQERCQFSAGGLVEISTEMLGKFLFGMISYIVICIQFSLNLTASNSSKVASIPTTNAPL